MKNSGVPAKEVDGKMKKRVKQIAENIVIGSMMLWIVASFSLLTIWILQEYQNHQRVMNQKVITVPEASKEELSAAHKYHGVNYARKDEGVWYFCRDGAKCELFAYKNKTGENNER